MENCNLQETSINLTTATPVRRRTRRTGARGSLVVLGTDGAGKSTTIAELVRELNAAGLPTRHLANPGGRRWLTRLGERLGIDFPPALLDLVQSAVRTVNVARNTVRAALFDGLTVMDRHLACQLVLRRVHGLPAGRLLPWLAVAGLRGARVVLLDVAPHIAHERVLARNEDIESHGYLAASRQAYLQLAAENGWTVIDAGQPPDLVLARLREVADR